MKPEVMAAAENFITNETEFHLGFLPTEQSNPLTRSMEADFRRSTVEGVATLQKPDRDVLSMVRRVLVSEPFARMAATGFSTVRGGGRMPDPFYFLRYALDPGGDGRFGVRFEELSPAELGSADLRRFGLVIIAGTVPENRCNEFVKNGGRLWRLPVPGGKQLPAAGKKAKFSGALAPLNDLLELDFIAWKQIAPLPVPEGAETWLSFSDGTALLTRRRLGDGIRFDSAFDLRNRASNWPLLRSFPVAMAKLVEAMAPDDASSVTRSEPAGAESEPAVASGAELRRTLPGVRELRLDGDWRLRLEELRRGTELAGWLLLTALLLFGVDCWMCRKEAA